MKDLLNKYIKFYKENIKKIHIVCIIISIILFILFLVSNIYKFENILSEITYEKITYIEAIKESLMLNFLIIFAGITPYCFLPIMGFSAIYILANKIAMMYILGSSVLKMIVLCILALLNIISYSLCIANGIYYCTISSKRFSYSQRKGFGFKDFKISIYKLRKNEQKVKEIEELKQKEIEKYEKLNVQVPYLNFTISYVISIFIIILTSIIIR